MTKEVRNPNGQAWTTEFDFASVNKLRHSSFVILSSLGASSFVIFPGDPMPRFVLLIHDHPFVHWDLLLESGATARTWRLLESPAHWLSAAPPVPVLAEPIADHRLMYLDYEGPISQERGRVARWDAGTFDWLSETSPVQVRLNGHKLKMTLTLFC